MRGIASLPMYDWPELREATDAFWEAVRVNLKRDTGLEPPRELERIRPSSEVWRDDALVLSQTCGWPYATRYRDTLHLVGVPGYGVEGCGPGSYSSAVIIRREAGGATLADLARKRFAYNSRDSQSGVHTLREALAWWSNPESFFGATLPTGGHRASLRAVAAGEADCAAIDAVCWAYAARFEPEAVAGLRVLAWTRPAPALPFVTSRANAALAAPLFSALREAISAGYGAPLSLISVAPPDEAAYLDLIERVRSAPEIVRPEPL